MCAQKAEIHISSDTKQAIDATRKLASATQKATKQMTADFQSLEKAGKMVGAGLAAVAMGGAVLIGKSTVLAARVQTLGVVMNQVGKTAGYTTAQMNQFEASVKGQGITTQVARTSLIRLAQANIDLADATRLAAIAQDAAVIAGINSSEAFERMIWGINTLNPRVLKTMGLTISLEQEYVKFAATTGKTVNEITMLEKKQIAVNAVMEAGVRISGSYDAAMETAGKKMTSLARHVEEARVAIGDEFLDAFAGAIDGVTDLISGFNDMDPSAKRFIIHLGAIVTGMTGIGAAILLGTLALTKLVPIALGAGRAIAMLQVGVNLMSVAAGTAVAPIVTLNASLGALASIAAPLILVGAAIALIGVQLSINAAKARDGAKATKLVADTAVEAKMTYMAYRRELQKTAEEQGLTIKVEEQVAVMRNGHMQVIRRLVGDIDSLTEAEYRARVEHEQWLATIDETVFDGWMAGMRGMGDLTDEQVEALAALRDANDGVGESLDGVGEEALSVADQLRGMGAAGTSAVQSLLSGFDDLWTDLAAGGPAARTAIENINAAILSGTITEEEGRLLSAQIWIGYERTVAKMEGRSFNGYALRKDLAEFLNVPLNKAWGIMQKLVAMDGRTIKMNMKITQTGHRMRWGKEPPKSDDARGGRLGFSKGGAFAEAAMSGKLIEVGEEGPEFILDGVVIPADMTRRMKTLGLGSAMGFAMVSDGGSSKPVRVKEPVPTSPSLAPKKTYGGSFVQAMGASGGAAPVATQVSAAVEATITATEEISDVTAAVTRAVTQMETATTQQQQLGLQEITIAQQGNARLVERLDELIEVVRRQGGPQEIVEGFQDAAQLMDIE